jgi:hypothetical protein
MVVMMLKNIRFNIIHIKVNGIKYYYDMENECWPSSVPNKVANSNDVAKALEHGCKRIAAGWT